MTELAYMPFYCGEWLLDTQDLKPDAYQAYHRLLCNMWLARSCTLPFDHQVLRRRAGFSAQKWPHVWSQIEHFFSIEEGQVGHQKLSKVRGKARATHAARSQAGTKGAKAKWRKNKETGDGRANGGANGKTHGNQNQTVNNNSARDAREGKYYDLKDGGKVAQIEIDAIREGKAFLLGNFSSAKARMCIDQGLVTEPQCKAVGLI